MAVMFLTGATIFTYPFFVDSLNNYLDQKRIAEFQQERFVKEEQKQKLAELERKNQDTRTNIPGMGLVDDPFESAVGRPEGKPDRQYYLDHTIGSIFIPTIHVSLPIFDKTNHVLLEKGVTVLQGSASPVGGESTHSILTGHSGLPDKKIFTDLEKLKKGNKIYLIVLGKKLAYEVIELDVVDPNDFSQLGVRYGQDILTLITCTPYSINTHRLLVTAKRIPYSEKMNRQIKKAQSYHKRRFFAIVIGSVLFLSIFFSWIYDRVKVYRTRKQTYDLFFYLSDGKQASAGIRVTASVRGKNPFTKSKGKKLVAHSDQNGLVKFADLPGERYNLHFDTPGWPNVKAVVRHVTDQNFVLRVKITDLQSLFKKKVVENKLFKKSGSL